MGNHKKAELDFVVSLGVHCTRALPQRGQDRSSKGAEAEDYVHIYRVIISLDFGVEVCIVTCSGMHCDLVKEPKR